MSKVNTVTVIVDRVKYIVLVYNAYNPGPEALYNKQLYSTPINSCLLRLDTALFRARGNSKIVVGDFNL